MNLKIAAFKVAEIELVPDEVSMKKNHPGAVAPAELPPDTPMNLPLVPLGPKLLLEADTVSGKKLPITGMIHLLHPAVAVENRG
jgi:hypothetical protein